jgi:glycosyltransferase involved in cell wall biosynthesis
MIDQRHAMRRNSLAGGSSSARSSSPRADSAIASPGASVRHTVLYVANAAKIGGGNKVLMDLIANLDSSRFAPTLVAPDEGPFVEWAVAAGIPCAVSRAGDWHSVRGTTRRVLELRRLIRQSGATLVHAAAPMAYRSLGIAAFASGARTVCHLGFPPEPGELEHAFVAGPDAVIGCYEGQADEHRQQISAIKRRCLVAGVPNGVDVDRFAPGEPAPEIRALRGQASTVIAILGHISDVKGYPAFVDAAAAIARCHESCEFWAIGADNTQPGARAAFEQRAVALGVREKIRFLGFRNDVHEVLKAVDIVALPSLAEGFPLALLEAMAAGKPVVATPVGGVPEALTDGVTGVMVPPGDATALSRAIQSLIADQDKRRRIGAAARSRAVTDFSVARFAARVQDIYAFLLNGVALPWPVAQSVAS